MAKYNFKVWNTTMATESSNEVKFETMDEMKKYVSQVLFISKVIVVSVKRNGKWVPWHKFNGQMAYNGEF